MNQKQGVILLETVLSITLFFIILFSTTSVLLKLQEKSKRTNIDNISLLTLEATKQFLDNNKNLNELLYSDNTLFYKGDLLLDNISKFNRRLTTDLTIIDICIDENRVCSKWKIKN